MQERATDLANPAVAPRECRKETASTGPPSNWIECPLKRACGAVDYGLTASASQEQCGPKFLRITDIVRGQVNWNTVPYVACSGDIEKYRLRDGDVVLARTGASTGASAYIKNPPPAVFASYLVRLRPTASVDARFLAYYLKSPSFTSYIRGVLGDKSAQPNASASTMVAAPFRAPRNLNAQRAIAHILGTLDDKIELNQRMNETLEAMARAIFKDWFVDFGPTRAKSEGRAPYLPPELWSLFPDSIDDSELGKTPTGWEIKGLSDCVSVVRGLSYKGSDLSRCGTPLHNLNSIYEGGGYKYEGIKYYQGEYTERHAVQPGDVIVANTEQGHNRFLIGHAAIVPSSFGDSGVASHHIYRVRPKANCYLTAAFLCHLLNSAQMHDTVSRYANWTTVNMLPIDGLQKPKVVCPPQPLVTAFDLLARNVYKRSEEVMDESNSLASLLETLLPELISGRTKIPDDCMEVSQ